MAVNTQPALRDQPLSRKPPAGQQLEQTEYQKKKSRDEKARREEERSHLERVSCLFRTLHPGRKWKRLEIMILGKGTSTSIEVDDYSLGSFQPSSSFFTAPPPFPRASSNSCLRSGGY